MGDGYDKQPVAGVLSLWPSQVSRDRPAGFWLIHVPTEVPCVTPMAWNGVNSWFHAIYNYNTQFCSDLNRKENAKKEKELQLLRATATQKRSGPAFTHGLQSFWKADRSQSVLLGRKARTVPWGGCTSQCRCSQRDTQVSGWQGWSPFACLTSTGQNLLLLMKGREELK